MNWILTYAPTMMTGLLTHLRLPAYTVLLWSVAGALRLEGAEMAFPGVDWKEATPESRQVEPTRLAAAVEF